MPFSPPPLLVSLAFHLLFLSSLFHLYFLSPVVHPSVRYDSLSGEPASPPTSAEVAALQKAPAKRLILIVGDGLRADTAFGSVAPSLRPIDAPSSDEPWFAMPHLRSRALHVGAFGLSHTRVPTESRPGHVALIAGMYEDVSAVTTGWAANPMPFDSTLNVSRHAFAFGSPDIVPLFAHGAPERIEVESYGEEEEDFSKDATQLDLWVEARFTSLLSRAGSNSSLASTLAQPGLVFFLHLLGPDTTGHTFRPFSREYVSNARVVDGVVRRVERAAERYWGDQRTAYVFSADHGMSALGNHGDGEAANTRTPLVAWGAGVRAPRLLEDEEEGEAQREAREEEAQRDAYFAGWGELDGRWREDVEQADVTPLMTTLLGLPMPANSEGKLPLDYLDLTLEEKAKASLANARGVLEMYRVKHDQRKARMRRFTPFAPLACPCGLPGGSRVRSIRALIASHEYASAIRSSRELLTLALQGSAYVQTYDYALLMGIISAAYLGSVAWTLVHLLRGSALPSSASSGPQGSLGSPGSPSSLGTLLGALAFALLSSKFALDADPGIYYAYAAFPCYFWGSVLNSRFLFTRALSRGRARYPHSSRPSARLLLALTARALAALAGLQLMVVGYLQRVAWTVGLLAIGFLWPACFMSGDMRIKLEGTLLLWGLTCLANAGFAVQGTEKEESVGLLMLSALLFLLVGLGLLLKPSLLSPPSSSAHSAAHAHFERHTLRVLKLQLCTLVLSACVTCFSSLSLAAKRGLPLPNQVLAWCILLLTPAYTYVLGFRAPYAGATQPPLQRLALIVFAAAPLFILLSLRDEPLFLLAYTAALLLWARIEGALAGERREGRRNEKTAKEGTEGKEEKQAEEMGIEHLRIALMLLFFLHVGFFGTGNVASISSFYLSPVYRLVPVFSPFLMAALLLLKILLPFLLLAIIMHLLSSSPIASSEFAHTSKRSGSGASRASAAAAAAAEASAPLISGLSLRSSTSLVLLAGAGADVMALSFLYAVRIEGSWLEIGRSITHFVMANTLLIFMLLLAALARGIIGDAGETTTTPTGKSSERGEAKTE